MRRTETERWALLPGAALCACAIACGDLGDVQVPLPIHGRTPPEQAELVLVEQDETPPQAVLSLAITPVPEGGCPIDVEALLPDASAAASLVNGQGPRAVHGQGVLIGCAVVERPGSDGVFDVDLSLLDPELPRLRAAGELGPASAGALWLELTTGYGVRLGGECPSQTLEMLDGAIWLRMLDCRVAVRTPRGGSCDVDVEAIFENCRQ